MVDIEVHPSAHLKLLSIVKTTNDAVLDCATADADDEAAAAAAVDVVAFDVEPLP